MSPKSLLRHPKVVSPMAEFTKGSFRELLPDTYATEGKVKRVLICSGKIYYDLNQHREENKRKDIAIVRIEQLYPFPDLQLDDELDKYPNADYVWVQEEPANMGYWWFVLSIYHKDLHLIARKRGSSPATGYHKQHEYEQNEIIDTAFSL